MLFYFTGNLSLIAQPGTYYYVKIVFFQVQALADSRLISAVNPSLQVFEKQRIMKICK